MCGNRKRAGRVLVLEEGEDEDDEEKRDNRWGNLSDRRRRPSVRLSGLIGDNEWAENTLIAKQNYQKQNQHLFQGLICFYVN